MDFSRKIILLNLFSLFLVFIAATGTILGGIVLALDKENWPIDAYILNIGQLSHILIVPISLFLIVITIAKLKDIKKRLVLVTIFLQVLFFLIAVIVLMLTWLSFFNYGFLFTL